MIVERILREIRWVNDHEDSFFYFMVAFVGLVHGFGL